MRPPGEAAEAVAAYQRAATLLHNSARAARAGTQAKYLRAKATEYLLRAEELSELEAERSRRDVQRQNAFINQAARQAKLLDSMATAVPTPSPHPPSPHPPEPPTARRAQKAVRRSESCLDSLSRRTPCLSRSFSFFVLRAPCFRCQLIPDSPSPRAPSGR